MSPSNRAGGTVDETVTDDAPVSNGGGETAGGSTRRASGNGGGNGDARGLDPAATSRPRRTTLTDSLTRPPARGSSTQRGTSSTTIARSGANGDSNEPSPSSTAVATVHTSPPVPAEAPPQPSLPAPSGPASAPAPRSARRLDQLDTGFIGPHVPSGPPPGPTRTTISDHLVAPVPRVLGRRPRVRKVTRVVRHVDPWSVFKVALVFNLVLYGVLLTAGVLLWNVAHATGTVDNVERFFESFGWAEFEFDGGAIFHNAWIAGLFGVIGLTGGAVLAATLFNLITDLVGGVRMTVLEEEVVEKTAAPIRRFVVQRPSGVGDDTGGVRRPGPPTSPPTNLPAREGG